MVNFLLFVVFKCSSVTCKVTLWGEVGERFIDEHKIDHGKGPLIIVFTSMRIKKYLGIQLSIFLFFIVCVLKYNFDICMKVS